MVSIVGQRAANGHLAGSTSWTRVSFPKPGTDRLLVGYILVGRVKLHFFVTIDNLADTLDNIFAFFSNHDGL